MTNNDQPLPNPASKRPEKADEAEKTRELIREFVETPPAKTMADVKAASEVYEANAQSENPERDKEKKPEN